MDAFLTLFGSGLLIATFAIAILAGVIKGMVGFGMPLILISGMGTFLPPEWALAGLLMPTIVTNGIQALRQGWRAAWASIRRFRRFLMVGAVTLLISAQFVRVLPQDVFLLLIGGPVTLFAALQLVGFRLNLGGPAPRTEMLIGAIAGAVGGISGTWGPPTVTYLTAIGTEKSEQVRVQGVIYGLGAVLLVFAHIGSGVLRAETAPFSLALVVPALLGTWIGVRVHDRIDQVTFRRATLIVLMLAGLNLIRRALLG